MNFKKLIIGAILIWTEIFPVGPQLRIFVKMLSFCGVKMSIEGVNVSVRTLV